MSDCRNAGKHWISSFISSQSSHPCSLYPVFFSQSHNSASLRCPFSLSPLAASFLLTIFSRLLPRAPSHACSCPSDAPPHERDISYRSSLPKRKIRQKMMIYFIDPKFSLYTCLHALRETRKRVSRLSLPGALSI